MPIGAKKIRILFTLSELMFGSKTRRLVDTIKNIDNEKFEIEVAATYLGDEATDEIKSLDVPLYQWSFFPINDRLNIKHMAQFFCSPLLLRHKRYNIVHSFHYNSIFTEALFCRLAKCKYVYTKSNLQWDNHKTQWILKSKLAERIIAQSNTGLDLLRKQGYADKSLVIHTGIDTDSFTPSSKMEKKQAREALSIPNHCFVIGYAAQYIEVKDHALLIRAFSLLTKRYNNILLLLCGDNYQDKLYFDIQNLINAESIRDKVVELGAIKNMEQFYRVCDCMAFTSNFENYSMVILEAMSSGLPVVASKFGGNLDQIDHGNNGFLADVGSHDDFAGCISKYIENPDVLSEHSKSCRQVAVRKFSAQQSVCLLEKEYFKIVAE